MRMDCPACGFANPPAFKFCGSCAASLRPSGACPRCAFVNPPGFKFCGECAGPLESTPARPSAVEPRESDPRVYTPKHLADRILQSKSALEGERKQVTVLFADVKGSMALAESVDPEQWHAILDGFFGVLAEGVHRFEGTVNQFTGDGIMALFGAPIAHEDHAQRACYAALQLRDDLAKYAREVKREHGLGFSVRMGLHSGDVIVGKIGDDLRMDYTAQGHTVGLAARMQELASPDTVYLTGRTSELVSGYFRLDDLGTFPVKGVADPVPVFQLQGIGEVRTRFDASRARGLTRFVGRDDDMQTLDSALARVREGNGQVVGIVADAGVGKSRLCFEFLERCRAEGFRVFQGSGVAHGKNLPLLPILQVFRGYYGITEQDTDQEVREKIAGRVLLFDEGYRDVLPLLFEFFGAPDPENPAPRMDPEARQRQLFGVLQRISQRDTTRGSILFMIEDLHWIDGASEDWLSQWVDAIGGASHLLLVNFRPEYRADWMQKSYYRQIPLAPLGPEAIRALIADLIGSDPSTAGLAAAIHARTAGNPFFAEEVVQSLIESRLLEGSRGSYRLVAPLERVEVPASVKALLGARIDRLPEREKQVLQTAAVIGKEFAEPILREVLASSAGARLSAGGISEALAALKSREFVYQTALYPQSEYAFKHPLTQEVALSSQLRENRARTHAAVARAIESAFADKLDEQAALLAHHCFESGDSFGAAKWHARAGELIGTSDFNEAARHWMRVRELVAGNSDEPKAAVLGARACRELLALSWRVGIGAAEVEALFDEGLAWAAHTGDPLPEGRLHQAMSVCMTFDSRTEAAIAHAREWTRVASVSEDPELRATALWPSLDPLVTSGNLAAARVNVLAQLELTRDHPRYGIRDWGMSAQANALTSLGRIERYGGSLALAREHLARSVAIARGLGDYETEGLSSGVLCELGFLVLDPEQSRPSVQRCVEISERLGATSRFEAFMHVGVQLLLDGDPARAVETLENALAATSFDARMYERRGLYFLALAFTAAGDPVRAQATAEQSLARCVEASAWPEAAEAALALSAALRAQGGADAAERVGELLERADRWIAETGATNLAPFVIWERAGLAGLRGEAPERECWLRRAQEEFGRIGAAGRARRAELELPSRSSPHSEQRRRRKPN
jgi:class 3 adenylate cyclase